MPYWLTLTNLLQECNMNQTLALWDKAKEAIQAASSIDEIKQIRDRAEAFRLYAKQQKESLVVQNKVAEITLRCEREIGKRLKEEIPHQGGRPEKQLHDATVIIPTLKDLGISKSDSARWQAIAELPDEQFEAHIIKTQTENEELTTVGLVRLARSLEKQEEIQILKEKGVSLPTGKYSTIVIDPPWEMKKIERDTRPNQVDFDYPTLETFCQEPLTDHGDSEIGPIPCYRGTEDDEDYKPCKSIQCTVGKFLENCTEENAHLYLWTTHKYLPDTFALVEEWGFNYQCLMTWVKNVGFTPFSWMYSTEHVLFCTKGNLPLLRKGMRLDFNAPVREHSRKPDIFYELVKEASPSPRIDMFGREKKEGFDTYGNEPEKF